MNGACDRGCDADRVYRALDGELGEAERDDVRAHVARCGACDAIVRVRARARSAWRAEMDRDDRLARAESEDRIAHAWRRPAPRRARTVAIAAAAAAIAACVTVVATSKLRAPSATAGDRSTEPPASVARTAPPQARASAPEDPKAEALARTAIVATSPCAECRSGTAGLEPGIPLAAEGKVVVPDRARVTLGFVVSGGLVDPTMGADVEGPATAKIVDPGSISIERGSARMRGVRELVVVVPGGRIAASRDAATYTVRVDDRGATRIVVESGRVAVTPRGGKTAVAVDAGAAIAIDARGASVTAHASPEAALAGPADEPAEAPAAPPAPAAAAAATPEEVLASARARAREGDADGARSDLEKLAARSDPHVARRASFTLAEIELASGAQAKGRERLGDLLACPEPSLAADAATLLARSFAAPADRAAAWGRYLATKPPSPHREKAMLERADALLDARRGGEANAVLDELRRGPLTDAQRRQLDRLAFKAREIR
jgi:hypothetical protein